MKPDIDPWCSTQSGGSLDGVPHQLHDDVFDLDGFTFDRFERAEDFGFQDRICRNAGADGCEGMLNDAFQIDERARIRTSGARLARNARGPFPDFPDASAFVADSNALFLGRLDTEFLFEPAFEFARDRMNLLCRAQHLAGLRGGERIVIGIGVSLPPSRPGAGISFECLLGAGKRIEPRGKHVIHLIVECEMSTPRAGNGLELRAQITNDSS